MGTDHRGRPTGNNHRPLPRLQAAIARQLQVQGVSPGLSEEVIEAHRQGAPVNFGSSVQTGPVATGLRPYVGRKEYSERMNAIPWSSYDNGVDDALDASMTSINSPYEVNKVVRAEGGTGKFISKAIKNRKESEGLEL